MSEQLTNLLDGINFYLTKKFPKLHSAIDKDELESLEKKFLNFYENTSQTGFYIHSTRENAPEEEVYFFNYNKEQGWWSNEENGTVFFDKDGHPLQLKEEQLTEDKLTLKQFAQDPQLILEGFKKYSYVLLVIYAPQNKLEEYETKNKSLFKNVALSRVTVHEGNAELKRISVFISKYDEFEKDKRGELDYVLQDIRALQPKLIVPCIVKEEIKYFIDDFEEDLAERIKEYTQQHRYECLYDSESDYSEKTSDDEEQDEEDQNNLDRKNLDKDENDSDEDSNSDDDEEEEEEEDNKKPIFVEKTA